MKPYRAYLSSTLKDLEAEREAVRTYFVAQPGSGPQPGSSLLPWEKRKTPDPR